MLRPTKALDRITRGFCCYNSKLARIFNEQGYPQLGRSFGDPKNPNCGGLAFADLEKLDFSKMDFSEFYADIKPKDLNPTRLTDRVTDKAKANNPNTGANATYFNGNKGP